MSFTDFKYLIHLDNPNHSTRKVIVRIFLGVKDDTKTGYINK